MIPNLEKQKIQVIVIGSSAGGIEVLKKILTLIPRSFSCSVVVVQHIGTEISQTLSQFFSEICQIPVKEAEDKVKIESGTIYFAPAGYHLLIETEGSFALNLDPVVNYARPSIDVLMETAAIAFGDKLLGIILTGANQDGAEGLRQISRHKGLTVVQDPSEATFPTMPLAALEIAPVDYILKSQEIADLIAGL